jgi:hypothetical protein
MDYICWLADDYKGHTSMTGAARGPIYSLVLMNIWAHMSDPRLGIFIDDMSPAWLDIYITLQPICLSSTIASMTR